MSYEEISRPDKSMQRRSNSNGLKLSSNNISYEINDINNEKIGDNSIKKEEHKFVSYGIEEEIKKGSP